MFSHKTLLILIFLAACITETVPSSSSINVDVKTISLEKGDTFWVNASCLPGKVLPIDWASDNVEIAIVDHGLVAALEAGIARINVRCSDGASTPIKVVVSPAKLLALHVSPEVLTISTGNRIPIAVLAIYSDGSTRDVSPDVSGGSEHWSSSNDRIAFVYDNELNTLQPGTATITVVYGNIAAITRVTVFVN